MQIGRIAQKCASKLPSLWKVTRASAEDDIWSDPKTEYLSSCAAGEVYEKLGLTGLVHPDRYPVPGDTLHEGHVGYHLRAGAHFFSREDWQKYMQFIRAK